MRLEVKIYSDSGQTLEHFTSREFSIVNGGMLGAWDDLREFALAVLVDRALKVATASSTGTERDK